MRKRKWLRATKDVTGLPLPIRGDLYHAIKSGKLYPAPGPLAEWLKQQGFFISKAVTRCGCCGPQYVEYRRTRNSLQKTIIVSDIPMI